MALPSKTPMLFSRINIATRRQGLCRSLSTVTNNTARTKIQDGYYDQEHQELQRSLIKVSQRPHVYVARN